MSYHQRSMEEALRTSVDALGGLQAVGYMLKRDIDPVLSGQWLAHCLTRTKRDKLSLTQIVLIFREAKVIGQHAGFEMLAKHCGYLVTAISDPAEEIVDLAKRAEQAANEAGELSREVMARMQAAGLKVTA
jgi:alpha-galactosidase